MQLKYFKDVTEWSAHLQQMLGNCLAWEHDYFPSNQQLAEGDEPTDQNIVIIARDNDTSDILGVFDCDMGMGVAVVNFHSTAFTVERAVALIAEYRDAQ